MSCDAAMARGNVGVVSFLDLASDNEAGNQSISNIRRNEGNSLREMKKVDKSPLTLPSSPGGSIAKREVRLTPHLPTIARCMMLGLGLR